jgi:predicted O-methyltransferase YrrM
MLSEFLTQLRASCTARRIPLISPESEEILRKFLEERKPKICLEIGSAVGYSSIVIASTIAKR